MAYHTPTHSLQCRDVTRPAFLFSAPIPFICHTGAVLQIVNMAKMGDSCVVTNESSPPPSPPPPPPTRTHK